MLVGANFSLVDAAFLLSEVRGPLEPVRLDDPDSEVHNLSLCRVPDGRHGTVDTVQNKLKTRKASTVNKRRGLKLPTTVAIPLGRLFRRLDVNC